jgi:hypothetical protein
MEKKHYTKTGIAYTFLTHGLFIVTIIFLSYTICNKSGNVNTIYVCVPIAIALIILLIVIDILMGQFDKVSFNEKGITTYRLFKKRFYPWDKVMDMDLNTDFFKEQHIITFAISSNHKKPLELVISDYGEILEDIGQYYSLDEIEAEENDAEG